MKKQSKKLFFIATIAFICFLIAFAMAFYEYGYYSYFESLVTAFIIAIYYFVLMVVALIYMHTPPIYKRSYIIMSILSTAFIAVLWVIFCSLTLIENSTVYINSTLWYPIVLTVLSLAMTAVYIWLALDIAKIDKKIKRDNLNNKE